MNGSSTYHRHLRDVEREREYRNREQERLNKLREMPWNKGFDRDHDEKGPGQNL